MGGFLLLGFCVFPLLCWLLISRDRATRIGVGIALAVCAAVVMLVVVGWVYVPSTEEVAVSYTLVAAALIVGGVLRERRRLDDWDRWPTEASRVAGVGLVLYFGLTIGCLTPLVFYASNSEGYVPDSRVVLPLPADLHVVGQEEDCGSGACSLLIRVGSHTQHTPPQVADRLREHLADRGWDVTRGAETCKRRGLWFDRSSLCVDVHVDGDHVVVTLTGGRAWA